MKENKENSSDIYNEGKYLENNPSWHEEDSPWKAKNIFKIMSRNTIHPDSISEIGCGAGEILNQLYLLLPKEISFTGYEISEQAFQICIKKAKNRLEFFHADFLKETSKCYDLLLVIDVVEHIEDYLGFLRKIKNRAEYKIFHFPLDISVQRVLLSKPILRRRREVGHLHYFTKETVLATLEDTGYKIVDHFYTASSIDLPSKSITYQLGKFPLKLASMINTELTARILGGHSLLILTK